LSLANKDGTTKRQAVWAPEGESLAVSAATVTATTALSVN